MPRQEIPEEALDNDGFLAGRFISPHARYSVAVHPGSERILTDRTGSSFYHKENDPILCQFEQSGLREHEIELAFERFNFSGLAEGLNPVTTIGVYDPEAQAIAADWEDEQRQEVERKLWFAAENKPGELLFVPSPKAPKPWPSYDSDTVEEIIDFQVRLDYDPEIIRSYESENANRDEVIEHMSELVATNQRGSSFEGAITVSA